jgi:hypothetical protein
MHAAKAKNTSLSEQSSHASIHTSRFNSSAHSKEYPKDQILQARPANFVGIIEEKAMCQKRLPLCK